MTWRIDWRASVGLLGTVVQYLAVTMVVPLAVAVVAGDDSLVFVVSMLGAVALGKLLEQVDPDPELGSREALLFVSLCWFVVAAVGAVPYLLAGYGTTSNVGLTLGSPGVVIDSVVNALFESMSGFTTTGATVLGDFDRHSRALLMWRQLTQWLGGMGIIVLMIAILPEVAVNGAELMKSEAPGPELQKLTPRIAQTARILWLIYFGFTVGLVCLLYGLHLVGLAPKMGLYNAVAHGFSTLPTGGFSPEANSIGAFSATVQWVLIPFLVVAGVNFALFWHVLRGDFRQLTSNVEFRAYAGAIAVLTAVLAALLFGGAVPATEPGGATEGVPENALRQAAFQIASLLNSTGFATADFAAWEGGASAQMVLLVGMFIGGCAGSTGGGIKVIRWLVVLKAVRRELYTTTSPATVSPVRLGSTVVDEESIRGIMAFTLLYFLLFGFTTAFLVIDPGHDVTTELTIFESASASLATIGNIGPGFGRVGPFGNYAFLSPISKLLLVGMMWLGRLEIVPVLALFVAGIDDVR